MKKHFVSLILLMTGFLCADEVSQYGYGELALTDIHANLKSIIIPASRFELIKKQGAFVDGSSLAGLNPIDRSDILVMPDGSKIYRAPWVMEGQKSLIMMGDLCNQDGSLYQDSPRTVLKNAVKHAHDMGFQPYFGIELEFFLLKKNQRGEYVPLDNYGYCDSMPNGQIKLLQLALMEALLQAGIEVEKIHHEVAPGQYEIVLKYTDPIQAADGLIIAKNIIQSAAAGQNLKATFMPKPLSNYNGSGMHVHVSLFDEKTNKNAFYDEHSEDHLSEKAKYFIAGTLEHFKEMTLLLNSSVNSFKRLVPGYEAPVYACWGKKNRSAALRIPEVADATQQETQGASTRVEYRVLDGSCNPYLAFAALLEAGIEGIADKKEVMPSVEKNLYYSSKEYLQEQGIRTIATSLEEAIDDYKNSDFIRRLLGDSLFEKYLTYKENEWNSYVQNEEYDVHVITRWEKEYHGLLS